MQDAPFALDLTATSQFRPVCAEKPVPKRVGYAVVVGGGTGSPVTIRCLLSLGLKVDAVVAMADDGGSTGALRDQADVTPPGDVRKCLTAFAKDSEDPFVKAFKYRFNFADNHALGNLILAALEDASGSFPEAIAICERILQAQGHVLPSTLSHVELYAQTVSGQSIVGQARACRSDDPLSHIWLKNTDGSFAIEPYQPALDALLAADYIVLGPGSLFTSIVANLAVPGIVDAIMQSSAKVVYVASIADTQGETRGFSIDEQVRAIETHGLAGRIDWVLADQPDGEPVCAPDFPFKRVSLTDRDAQALAQRGISICSRDFYNMQFPSCHELSALVQALGEVLG